MADITYRLNVYGENALRILDAVKQFCETERYGRSKPVSSYDSRSFKRITFTHESNNEISFTVDSGYSWQHYVFSKSSDQQYIRKWLANTVKGVIKYNMRPSAFHNIHTAGISACEEWSRMSKTTVMIPDSKHGGVFMTIDVPDAYALYEAILGRKINERAYPDGVVKRVVGQQFDPVRTEIETAYKEQLAALKAENEANRQNIANNYETKWNDLRKTRDAEFMKEDEAYAKRVADLRAEVEASLAALASEASSAA